MGQPISRARVGATSIKDMLSGVINDPPSSSRPPPPSIRRPLLLRASARPPTSTANKAVAVSVSLAPPWSPPGVMPWSPSTTSRLLLCGPAEAPRTSASTTADRWASNSAMTRAISGDAAPLACPAWSMPGRWATYTSQAGSGSCKATCRASHVVVSMASVSTPSKQSQPRPPSRRPGIRVCQTSSPSTTTRRPSRLAASTRLSSLKAGDDQATPAPTSSRAGTAPVSKVRTAARVAVGGSTVRLHSTEAPGA